MDSSGTHRLCGHRVVLRRLSWVLFSILVERFSLDLLETAWPLLIGVSVSESLVPRLTVGSRQASCVLYAAGPVLSWGSWLGVRRTVQIRGA